MRTSQVLVRHTEKIMLRFCSFSASRHGHPGPSPHRRQPQSRSGRFGDDENLLPLPGLAMRPPYSLVSILSVLSQLYLYVIGSNEIFGARKNVASRECRRRCVRPRVLPVYRVADCHSSRRALQLLSRGRRS